MTRYNVFIENNFKEYDIDELSLYKNVLKMTEYIFSQKEIIGLSCLKDLKYKEISFDIVLTDKSEIQRINREYRKKDTPTDVITFAVFADSPSDERFILDGEINLGEIIISPEIIRIQATENNNTFNDELNYIIAHGILHLAGFDHTNEEDYQFMVENQNKAKAQLL